MLTNKLVLTAACGLLLVSCGQKTDTPKEVVKPVKIAVAKSMSAVTKNYAGVVQSDQVTNLAFKVAGQIINLPVDAGDRVKKGDVIAEIDTRDFKLQYEVDRSAYVTAKAQYERFQRLLAKEAVSQQDYEVAETNYDKAKAALENSQNVLNDAQLLSPFDGTVERKLVENYQRVNVGETIIRLVNTGNLYVSFNMADYNLAVLKYGKPDFSVRFNSLNNIYYKARLREYTDISTDGSGIPVSLWIEDKTFKNVVIKPGFSCDVKVDFHFSDDKGAVVLPISSVFVSEVTGTTSVWVVTNDTLELRKVSVAALNDKDQISVLDGVSVGEKVIAAGAVTLNAGQRVKIIN